MTFVDDSTGTLGTDAIGRINMAATSLDVKVVVASTASRGELDSMVGRLVNSANTLAIGVDPVHHYTFTHFGTGTGISGWDFQTVARAGNGEFKAGHWEQGIEAIVASANAASVRTAARSSVIVQQPVTVVEHPVSAWPFIMGAVAFVFAAVLLVRWLKKRQADQASILDGFREEASQMRTRNIEEQGWHDRMKENQSAAPERIEPSPAVRLAEREKDRRAEYKQRMAEKQRAATPEELDRAAYLRSRNQNQYPAPPALPVQNNYYGNGGSSSSDMALGYLIGSNAAQQRETVVVREEPRHRHDTPAPSSSSSDWGGSSGGGGFDGGSGGGDF